LTSRRPDLQRYRVLLGSLLSSQPLTFSPGLVCRKIKKKWGEERKKGRRNKMKGRRRLVGAWERRRKEKEKGKMKWRRRKWREWVCG
jgi:hypothetical protein